ncbi:MAG: hypothetical protein Q8930_18605 [Bacillota bacterium]|nr:hypothetical protein [Bacillota bacterium]
MVVLPDIIFSGSIRRNEEQNFVRVVVRESCQATIDSFKIAPQLMKVILQLVVPDEMKRITY